MVVIKWADTIKGKRVKVDGPLCGELYKEYHGSIFPWSGTYTDDNLNCFTWYKEENDCIFLGDQYNEEFKNWRLPIHNGQFCPQTINRKRRTERIQPKYSGYVNFNGIPREGNPDIPFKSYKYQ